MELVTVILSGLLTLISPVGIVAEETIANRIRAQVQSIDELKIRIDNIPSYQIIEGKVDRIRLSSRGIQVNPDFRISSLDLETDPIDVDLQGIQTVDSTENLAKYLQKPAKVALKIGFREIDINLALRSSQIRQLLEDKIAELLPPKEDGTPTRLEIQDLQIDLETNNRIAISATVQNLRSTPENPSFSQVNLEFGIKTPNGRILEIIEPTGRVNDKKLRESILRTFAKRFAARLDLQQLESAGIFVRVLQLNLEPNQLNFVIFIKIDPK
jgi:LmeA-like phospholipid-binding